MERPPLRIIFCLALFLCTACLSYAASVTVDASTSTGNVNARVLGYGFDYKWDSWGLWDPTTKALKTTGFDVVEASGFRAHAMLRFYCLDDSADTQHWRRGVGPKSNFETSGNNRPLNPTPHPTNNDLGTDEVMSWVHDNWANADVVIGVNWWGIQRVHLCCGTGKITSF